MNPLCPTVQFISVKAGVQAARVPSHCSDSPQHVALYTFDLTSYPTLPALTGPTLCLLRLTGSKLPVSSCPQKALFASYLRGAHLLQTLLPYAPQAKLFLPYPALRGWGWDSIFLTAHRPFQPLLFPRLLQMPAPSEHVESIRSHSSSSVCAVRLDHWLSLHACCHPWWHQHLCL